MGAGKTAFFDKKHGRRAGRKCESRPARTQPLVGQIEDALAKGDLKAAQRLVPRLLEQPRVTADILLQIGVDLAQHDLYSEAAQVFGPQVFEGSYISRWRNWPSRGTPRRSPPSRERRAPHS